MLEFTGGKILMPLIRQSQFITLPVVAVSITVLGKQTVVEPTGAICAKGP
jgi:hypothetical protein